MHRIGSQDYSVARTDFPIHIEIEAFDLSIFQGEPSQVVVTRPDNTPITTFEISLQEPADKPLLRTCDIPDPGNPITPPNQRYEPPAEVTFTFVLGFDTPTGSDPRYEVRMTAATADHDKRNVRPPDRRITTHLEYR